MRFYNFLILYAFTKFELCMDSNMILRDNFALITFGTRTRNKVQMFGYHYRHDNLKHQYMYT